jgi:hypothetical protein
MSTQSISTLFLPDWCSFSNYLLRVVQGLSQGRDLRRLSGDRLVFMVISTDQQLNCYRGLLCPSIMQKP